MGWLKSKFFFLFLLFSFFGNAQSKYWVFFTDKKGTSFNPYEYFDKKAIERRIKNNIPLSDSTDFPVNESYINAVKQIADSVSYATRWFNAIAVYASETEIKKIKTLSFVRDIKEMLSNNLSLCEAEKNNRGDRKSTRLNSSH